MRARIIDVALELFARRGVDGVSIAEVAVAAGASNANVMHHFGSKDGLYAACLDAIGARLDRAVDEASRTAICPARSPGGRPTTPPTRASWPTGCCACRSETAAGR